MTRPLEKIPLGSAAIDYIRRGLGRRREFSRSLQRNLKLDLGEVTTLLPLGFTPEAIEQFEFGGKLPQSTSKTYVSGGYVVPAPNLDDVLIARIQQHLALSESKFCIFENGTVRPNYPASCRLPGQLHTMICGDTFCHSISATDRNLPDLIRLTIRVSRSPGPPYLVGSIGTMSSSFPVSLSGCTDSSGLDHIAGLTEEMFVGAYDGEGFLTWKAAGDRWPGVDEIPTLGSS